MEEKTNAIIEAIVIISAIFVMVAVFVIVYFIYFKRRKEKMADENRKMKEVFQTELLQSRIEVQEQTFQQIGKELHDNVGQLLSTSRMLIGLTERELKNPPDTLLTANATLGQAINEIRSLAKSLDKEWLERFSFSENLQTVIDRINAGAMIKASYQEEDPLLIRSDEQIIVFRIVQEALQNAVKHADATSISVRLWKEEAGYNIHVTDDGRGFDTATVRKNMGLSNMEHRVHLLKGSINIQSSPSKGTDVHICLPVQTSDV